MKLNYDGVAEGHSNAKVEPHFKLHPHIEYISWHKLVVIPIDWDG